MDGNYIKLSRSLLEWEWYGNINTCRLFLHMILKANWKDGRFEGTTVPRGSFVSSYPRLADECGLTVNEVRTALKHLISTGEITVKAHAKYSVFTVVRYNDYQEVNSQGTVKPHSINRRLTTIEEGKKERNNNNITGACVRFEEFWNSYPKQTHRMLAEQAYCTLVSSGITEDALITASGNYAEYCQIKHTQQEFISHPDNWLNKSKWTDYTVEKYKKPVLTKDSNQNKFNNFPQRNYDFDALEKQALRGQDSG